MHMIFAIAWVSLAVLWLAFQALLACLWRTSELRRDLCACIGASALVLAVVLASHDAPWTPNGLSERLAERIKQASPRYQRHVSECPDRMRIPVSR